MSIFDLLNSKHYIKNERVVRERVNTCFWCPFYVSATGQCSDCWCFIKAKAKLKTEDCPQNKWQKLEQN